jgi:hypothetical protein
MLQNAAAEVVPRYEAPRQGPENVVTLISVRRTSFDPEALTAVTAAYHAVLTELCLSNRENAGTLMVARRVIEIAARGERDPHRLAAAALEALSQ